MSSVKDRTHDISLIDHHVKDVKALCEILDQAVSAAFPRNSRSRYSGVHVLLLSWEDDDLGVTAEIDELEDVFVIVYCYETERWKIPGTKSHNALSRRIMRLLDDFESSDKLLVVYYGGHGYMNEDRQCVWLCNQRPEAATVQWWSIQTNLEEADSDVLILLDCCAAASSAGGSGKGITELIAACGFETFAPGVGEHSFTRSLIEELRYYGQRLGPISTAFLHNKVLARTKKSWNPRYASDALEERRKTPIHIHLADRSMQRCIELTPISPRPLARDDPRSVFPAPGSTSGFFNIGASDPSSSSEDVDMSDPTSSSHTSLSEVWPDPQYTLPKVLVTVALEQDQVLRADDLLDWLKSFPAVANCVHVESAYKSDSTLLLLSIPVAIWDMLPKNPAISFVAFVKSNNLLDSRELATANAATTAMENKRAVRPNGRLVDKFARLARLASDMEDSCLAKMERIIQELEREKRGRGPHARRSLHRVSRHSGYAEASEKEEVDDLSGIDEGIENEVTASVGGYRLLVFRTTQYGPMSFVEFEDVSSATKALNQLDGRYLSKVMGEIRLSFSNNPSGVRGQPGPIGPPSSVSFVPPTQPYPTARPTSFHETPAMWNAVSFVTDNSLFGTPFGQISSRAASVLSGDRDSGCDGASTIDEFDEFEADPEHRDSATDRAKKKAWSVGDYEITFPEEH
ncbi:MAG: hypothetical protein Q9170_003390 [Blastenia crenularia]